MLTVASDPITVASPAAMPGWPPRHARRSPSVMPAGPSLSCLPAPPCHTCRPLPVIPAGPSLSYLPAPPCHTCRPLSVIPAGSSLYACRPFSVMPVGPPLSFPQFLAGIQSKQSFSRVQSGSHIPLTRRAWTPSRCWTLNAEKVRQGTTLDSRLQTSGMTGGGAFVGNNRRGSFRMGERDADDVRDENHETTGFFQQMAKSRRLPSRYSCRGLSLSYLPALLCHTRRPLSVMPAGPSLSCLPAPLCHARRPPLSCP